MSRIIPNNTLKTNNTKPVAQDQKNDPSKEKILKDIVVLKSYLTLMNSLLKEYEKAQTPEEKALIKEYLHNTASTALKESNMIKEEMLSDSSNPDKIVKELPVLEMLDSGLKFEAITDLDPKKAADSQDIQIMTELAEKLSSLEKE